MDEVFAHSDQEIFNRLGEHSLGLVVLWFTPDVGLEGAILALNGEHSESGQSNVLFYTEAIGEEVKKFRRLVRVVELLDEAPCLVEVVTASVPG